tara:strand:+ start:960 stop:1268 length:309 start_codon:yes stop_codon:yes gene_type:complete
MKTSKLVRDRIPAIIGRAGKRCTTYIAGDAEYQEKLWEKLNEEVDEFKAAPSEEELADILEVVEAITTCYGFDPYDVETARQVKAGARGGFKGRVVLEEVLD